MKNGKNGFGRSVKTILPPVLLLAVLLLLWEAAVRIGDVSSMILPAPSRILTAGWKDRASLLRASTVSIKETLAGVGLGLIVSFVLAILIDAFSAVRRALYPLLVSAQTMPVVAVAPLLIIWFGFGLFPKILLVMLYTSFPMIVSLTGGMDTTPKSAENMFRTLGYGKWSVIFRVRLPYALPSFFSGLRVSASCALGTAVIGEFLGAANGLGIYITGAKSSFRTDLVFAASAATILLTLILYGVVILAEHICLPWAGKREEGSNG